MNGLKRLGAFFALSAAFTLQTPAFAVDWDFATANAPGNYQTKLDEKFAAEVAAATNNEVKINIHAGGQLGFKGPEMLSVIRDGLVPIGSFQFAQQVGISPILGASSVPYLVSGFDEMKTFRSVSKPYYDAEFKKFNQKLLLTIPWPGQNVFSKVELSNSDTFRTMKIRTTDRNGSDFFRSLGASPAQIPWGEVVPALSTGVINSVSTSTSSAVDGQFWDFQKACNVVNWQSNFEGVSVNLDAWNKLSAKNQKAIEEVVARLEPVFWDAAKAEDSKNFETLKAKGMEIYTPPAAVRDAMAAKGKPSWTAIEDAVPAAKPLLKSYLTAVGKQ
ncbi:TRAP transporter substrate-binding protein [Caballeronia sp. LZ003]|uniref:TRAP transporter substrate-binding protein n=1 Tax=Caballeronia sp. LZ003 TaxID=3038559 RepID=UPI0028667803|nr:TRAP transporter substrate-binding protein [Caballeronia sp. LZ003]MDR5848628.1 TRAP transporter substrate-binding protein [Caballeronia sp. LZ003]